LTHLYYYLQTYFPEVVPQALSAIPRAEFDIEVEAAYRTECERLGIEPQPWMKDFWNYR
jgi:hypothetical protein